ncbi:MAG: mandelate racemase/muconate lactonizing enzyme family protein [Acidobacteriota bacterium]|nr:mandelate racemase/muconate lactonizing enzyme family protein [Acidobacteriota bacterium]
MRNNRREFIKSGVAVGALSVVPHKLSSASEQPKEVAAKIDKAMNAPVLRTEFFKQAVKIASVELLKSGKQYLVRVRSTDGAVGIAVAHPSVIATSYPILLTRVAPFFVGKDARDLDSLLEGVYLHNSNYKWQGLPFWVSVASTEFAILDLLGRIAGKPVGELLGRIVRREVAVYRASGNRGNSPEKEIEYLRKLIGETGAKAIKFRLGGRMKYNEETTRRDEALIRLTRKALGDGMTIYADANGSYDVPMAIRIGKMMEEYKLNFLEEPCRFDYYDETKQIADSLTIPIAGGECESSMRRFRSMIENDVVQIVQPDLFYFGGLIRSLRVARMAEAAGMDCTPHMSGDGLGYLYVLHYASCVPNAGPFQEYKGETEGLPISSAASSLKSENGVIKVPTEPGLGVTIDPDFIRKSTVVSS